MRKLLAVLLSVILIISIIPISTITASATTYSGTCGDNLTWELDTSTGVLTISGTGNMGDWGDDGTVPWDLYKEYITSVVICDGVTSIGDWAFAGLTGLTSIMIPKSVERIGNWAFAGCMVLTEISVKEGNAVYQVINNCLIEVASKTLILGCKNSVIPTDGSVIKIGNSAFSGCTGLTTVTIPACITNIADWAFAACTGLTEINVEVGNPVYQVINNCLIETASKTLVLGCQNSIIPSDGNVTKIGDSAFAGCTGLTSVIIPSCVTSISNTAFTGCYGIGEIIVEDGNTVYHSANNCIIETASKTLIVGCKNSTIPSDGTVTAIGESAFFACTNLRRITIPEYITSIGDYAFYGCENLRFVYNYSKLNIVKGSTDFGYVGYYATFVEQLDENGNAFGKCGDNLSWNFDKLTGILTISGTGDMWESAVDVPWGRYKNDITTLIIGDGVTSICDFAFVYCYRLTQVTIPQSVKRIGAYAFFECPGLTMLTISDGVEIIGESAFGACRGLTQIVIPDSVTSIESGAFEYCTGLKHIVIPDSVTNLGSFAFEGCTGLITVMLSNNITSINNSLFLECTNLARITVPENVTYIGYRAFANCSNLTMVIIKENVTSITETAFDGCGCVVLGIKENSYGQTYVETYIIPYVVLNEHDFIVIKEKDPTCTSVGFIIYKCSICGETKTERKDVIPHDYKIISNTDATYLQSGESVCKCEICQNEKTEFVFALWDMDKNGLVDQTDYDLFDTETTDLTRFDINDSGDIDAFDQVVIMHLKNKTELQEIGDVNGDGTTNLKDVVRAKKISVGFDVEGDINRNFDDKTDGKDLVFIQEFANCYLFKEW